MYNGYYYGFDMTYLVLVVPALLIALIAQIQVKSAFSRYAGVRCTSGLTGAQAAQRILQANGITDVRIEHISGKLTDHFDPQAKVIRLSDEVYGVASIAAVGVAAHEAGHAVQYATDYAPIRIRAAIIPATRIGSNLSWPLLIAGLMGHARADRPNSMKPCSSWRRCRWSSTPRAARWRRSSRATCSRTMSCAVRAACCGQLP